MSKLTKRKTIVEVGKRCPTNYEIAKTEKEKAMQALELAKSQNKPIKYDLKR